MCWMRVLFMRKKPMCSRKLCGGIVSLLEMSQYLYRRLLGEALSYHVSSSEHQKVIYDIQLGEKILVVYSILEG